MRGRAVIATDRLSVGFMAPSDAKQIARLEQLAVDSLWAGGHVASRNPSTEAMMSLARISAVTDRVRVGTAILLLPLYPPALVAKQVADLDRATSGRLVLGVGVGGEYPQEFRACQVPLDDRGARIDEAISLVRQLWTAQEITHEGRFYAVNQVRIHPAPHQAGGPPIVIAGRGQAAMRRAAGLGDGWMPYLFSPRRYAASVETIQELAAAQGRDLGAFEWYAFVFVNIDDDGVRARQQTADTLGRTYNQDLHAMIDNVAAAGTSSEVRAKLQSYVDAGARHFIFVPATGASDPDPVIRRLLDEVVPALSLPSSAMSAPAPAG